MSLQKNPVLAILLSVALISGLLFSDLRQCSAQSSEQLAVDLNNPAVAFGPADVNLHIRNSRVVVNGETLFSVGGETGGHVIWFFSPSYGRFIFSTRPHPKYQFQEVKVLNNRKIVFEADGKQFEWIVADPLSDAHNISHLWMMHDKHPEPLKEKKIGGETVGASSHYEYLLPSN